MGKRDEPAVPQASGFDDGTVPLRLRLVDVSAVDGRPVDSPAGQPVDPADSATDDRVIAFPTPGPGPAVDPDDRPLSWPFVLVSLAFVVALVGTLTRGAVIGALAFTIAMAAWSVLRATVPQRLLGGLVSRSRRIDVMIGTGATVCLLVLTALLAVD